ncbi:methylthioribulose-1-phosphate dehydratase [Longimycelium tulufanense]|uniref:Methylthioribulose-1-phosphate dehydratase n=1 Tax=Longimycelium tulufanense TaxID=907463 RepID=A0A8J3CAG7_9PSEU|nr:methylthioribulose 1-phosphate dehydratase [Longimycelium tulufanense]GGM40056.1 methylthioribulose-1-phosphate dehydratase [Longimycelium tulufanense]
MTSIDLENAAGRLAELSRGLYHRGWMEGTAGNLSVRLGDDSALITASGRSKGELSAGDVVEVDISDSRPVHEGAPRPSAETTIHTALYRLFPDCGAVVHAHPPYSTAVAAREASAGRSSITFSEFEIIKGIGSADPFRVQVPIFPNWPEVPRIADDVTAGLAPDAPPVFLIAHHGATAWGPTPEVARNRLECLESLCQLHLLLNRG